MAGYGDGAVAEIRDITGGVPDYAVEATDGANMVAMAALGIRGTCAVVGGAKAVRGIMGGGTTPDFHLSLMRLQAQGRFPLKRLVKRYVFADVNQAIDDSDVGTAIKPILMMDGELKA